MLFTRIWLYEPSQNVLNQIVGPPAFGVRDLSELTSNKPRQKGVCENTVHIIGFMFWLSS
jgi:uncharacterized protein YfdQ (DUF2303 family)